MSPPLVLLTDGAAGQARSTLSGVRALAQGGYAPVVTESGARSLAGASRFCARTVEVPPATEPGYAAAVQAELASRDYVAVLPCSDAALLALGYDVSHLVDKERLAAAARACGLSVPNQHRFESWPDL